MGSHDPTVDFRKIFRHKKAVGIFLTNTTIIVLNFLVFGLREAIISACSIYLIAFFMNILLKGQRQFVKRKEAKESTLASAPVKEKERLDEGTSLRFPLLIIAFAKRLRLLSGLKISLIQNNSLSDINCQRGCYLLLPRNNQISLKLSF